jgi:membrane protein implicated in regulation of membrane protease activity
VAQTKREIKMPTINPEILLGIGIALIALEIFMFSFYLMWLGFGFLLIGIISYFYHFDSGLIQVALSSILGVALLMLFKDKFKKYIFKNTPKSKDEFLDEAGQGVVKEGKVFYKGTFWEVEGDSPLPKEGEKINIKKVVANKVII